MNRIRLAAIVTVALALAQDAGANPGRNDRTFTGNHEWLTGSTFEIEGRPAQQIAIESRFLIHDTAALDELGVSPVINGVTLLVPKSDGTTGVFRTPMDASTGFIYIDNIFGPPSDVVGTTSTPIGLGYLYGDQILIDVRMGDAASYDPTAIDSNASLSEKFQTEIAGITESGFGMPRLAIRDLPTQVLISDGKSMVMGFESGLREYREETDIPLLSDIPLLGRLFVGHVRETEQRALIIHISPTIVSETDETE